MAVNVKAVTELGGAVELNADHGITASYAVAGVGDSPRPPLLYVHAGVRDGRTVQVFFNRDTGLLVVDIVDADGKGGREIVRQTLTPALSAQDETRANAMFQTLTSTTAKRVKRAWRNRKLCVSILASVGLSTQDAELVAYWLMLQNS